MRCPTCGRVVPPGVSVKGGRCAACRGTVRPATIADIQRGGNVVWETPAFDNTPFFEKCEQIVLPFPPSVNNYWRHTKAGGHYICKAGVAYRANVIAACSDRAAGTYSGRIELLLKLYPPDKVRRDLDNCCKALLDALSHAGVYEDDSQIDHLTLARMPLAPPDGKVVAIIRETTWSMSS